MKTLRLKVSGGDMYPGVATVSPLRGESPCPDHLCEYCYVEDIKRAFPTSREKYSGPFVLDERIMTSRWVLDPDVKLVLIQSMGDLFAKSVLRVLILSVLAHCRRFFFPYLFQSKNPARFEEFMLYFPLNIILGTTIETDEYPYRGISQAPSPEERYKAMKTLIHEKKMVSIEPIIKCHPKKLIGWIESLGQYLEYVSIGADSGNNHLPEPTAKEVNNIIWGIAHNGWRTQVRLKKNLLRRYEIEPELLKYVCG